MRLPLLSSMPDADRKARPRRHILILTKQAASEKEIQTAFARRPVPARCGRPAGVAPSQAECGVAHFRWCWTGVSGWGRVAPQGCPGGDSLGTGDVGRLEGTSLS